MPAIKLLGLIFAALKRVGDKWHVIVHANLSHVGMI